MNKSGISKSQKIKGISYTAEAKKMESYLHELSYVPFSRNDSPYVENDIFLKKLPDGAFSVLHRIGNTNYFVEAVRDSGPGAKLDARTCALNLKTMTVKQLAALDKDSNRILDSNEFLK